MEWKGLCLQIRLWPEPGLVWSLFAGAIPRTRTNTASSSGLYYNVTEISPSSLLPALYLNDSGDIAATLFSNGSYTSIEYQNGKFTPLPLLSPEPRRIPAPASYPQAEAS